MYAQRILHKPLRERVVDLLWRSGSRFSAAERSCSLLTLLIHAEYINAPALNVMDMATRQQRTPGTPLTKLYATG